MADNVKVEMPLGYSYELHEGSPGMLGVYFRRLEQILGPSKTVRTQILRLSGDDVFEVTLHRTGVGDGGVAWSETVSGKFEESCRLMDGAYLTIGLFCGGRLELRFLRD